MLLQIFFGGTISGSQAQGDILAEILPFPIDATNVPLRDALSRIDSGLLEPRYVIFGVELAPRPVPEPLITLHVQGGARVAEVLAQIMRQAQGYAYSVVNTHLISVYSVPWQHDSRNLLNTRIEKVELSDQAVVDLLHTPWVSIAEVRQRMYETQAGRPATFAGEVARSKLGPKLSLKLENVTLRDVLNAAAETISQAPPPWSRTGWVYEFDSTGTNPFQQNHWTNLFSTKVRENRNTP